MTYYIGKDPNTLKADRYFYGLKRDDEEGFVVIEKINLDKGIESLDLVDLSKVTGELQPFEYLQEGTDFFDGRSVDHDLQYDGLNYEQFKWSSDNLFYFIDDDGQLCLRITTPYNYSEGVTTLIKPSEFLKGDPVILGFVASTNPLENNSILDLGKITDSETTILALDAGTII